MADGYRLKMNPNGSYTAEWVTHHGDLNICMDPVADTPVFASQPRTCEDCKGKGKIELFVSIETCRKCGGKGTV
jgi:DnaJ-class molecular chaperone